MPPLATARKAGSRCGRAPRYQDQWPIPSSG